MSESINWNREIENIKLRIDRCEKLANTLRTSLTDLIREIRTCESLQKQTFAKQSIRRTDEFIGKNKIF